MIIPNDKMLSRFRGPGYCEYCNKFCRMREAAHVFSVGAGRLDIRHNLLAVGSTPNWCCTCHTNSHLNPEVDFLAIVAAREKCLQDSIREVVWFYRRLPKNSTRERIEREIETLTTCGAMEVALKTLEEIPNV